MMFTAGRTPLWKMPGFGFGLIATGILTPIGAAALLAIGCPALLAWLLAPAGSAALTLPALRLLSRRFSCDVVSRGSASGLQLLGAIVGLLAVVQSARLSAFMHDPQLTADSVIPQDSFLVHHSCFTAYYEAARLAGTVDNIYLPSLYKPEAAQAAEIPAGDSDVGAARAAEIPAATAGEGSAAAATGKIGPFNIDTYQYPPVFLLGPKLAMKFTGDFLKLRTLWYALDAVLLAFGLLALAGWIGGFEGWAAALLAPFVWIALTTQSTLQIGNFQLAVFALTALAMVAFESRHPVANATGGALLAYVTLSKMSPGLLILYLAAKGKWKAVVLTGVMAAVETALAFALLGRAPFDAFLRYQLPRISSGEAFPMLSKVAVGVSSNHSIFGMILKLKAIGVPGMTIPLASQLSWVYTVALAGLAVFLARRAGIAARTRLQEAAVWLLLLYLASLRSPFVSQEYALIGPVWILTLVVAGWLSGPAGAAVPAEGVKRSMLPGLLLAVVTWLALNLIVPHDVAMPPGEFMAIASVSQAAALALAVVTLKFALATVPANAKGGILPVRQAPVS